MKEVGANVWRALQTIVMALADLKGAVHRRAFLTPAGLSDKSKAAVSAAVSAPVSALDFSSTRL